MSDIEMPDVIGATRRAETIRQGMISYAAAMDAIGEAYEARDWVTLKYPDWDTYCEKEFSEKRLKLTRAQREQAVLAFRGAGMSTRAIASALGVSDGTVRNDLAGAQNYAPAEVRGADGKTYAPTRPVGEIPQADEAQTSGLVDDTSPADESGEDHTDEDASGTADRDASSAQPDVPGVASGSAPAEHVETPPGPEDSTPADEPEQAAEGVPLPAPATPKSFDEVLDEHVPNLDPHQKWRAAFLRAVRQSYALSSFAIEDIAVNGNELCFEELINLRDFVDDLLTKVQQKRLENLPDNVREFRRPA